MKEPARPAIVSVLASFSIAINAFLGIGLIVILLAAGLLEQVVYTPSLYEYIHQGYDKIIPQLAAVAFSFFGAIQLLNFKKRGLSYFAGGKAIWLVFHPNPINIVWSILLLAIFAYHFKNMN